MPYHVVKLKRQVCVCVCTNARYDAQYAYLSSWFQELLWEKTVQQRLPSLFFSISGGCFGEITGHCPKWYLQVCMHAYID